MLKNTGLGQTGEKLNKNTVNLPHNQNIYNEINKMLTVVCPSLLAMLTKGNVGCIPLSCAKDCGRFFPGSSSSSESSKWLVFLDEIVLSSSK